jgi:two-component system sensor histidine kinase GlrK
MKFWQPRSVLQLVLVSFFVALAPLVVAIFYTVQTLGNLAEQSQAVTHQVVDITRLGQEIQRDVLELERRARQFLALADPELAQLFGKEREALAQKLRTLQGLIRTDSPDITGLLHSLRELNLESPRVREPEDVADAGSPSAQRLEQAFSVINDQAKASQRWLLTSLDQLLDSSAAEAEEAIDSLVLQVSLLALTTTALLFFFTYWINKPVQDLSEEIHLLGTAGLSHTIEISGPQELKALGTKLEWLRRKLHESEQQKEQFLRHISHELKTPLASLREGADLLAEHVAGRLSQQQQEIIDIVRQNGIELQRLIENLIDYNQLPEQAASIERFSIDALWEELLAHYRLTISKKDLQLALNGNVDYWRADRYRLGTTLDNLLSNAVNYTPEGGLIDIKWREEDANLLIDVANSGPSIPEEDAERVFEPFFQSAAKRTGPIKGSGIGLSVARDCIEAQGGSLTLVHHKSLPVCFRVSCPAH